MGIVALLAVYADAPAAENFGRLFFSLDERRILDDLRDDPPPSVPVTTSRSRIAPAPVVAVISFDGKVERNGGGGTTVWVNGKPVLASSKTAEGISVEPDRGTDGKATFILPPSDSGKTAFSLKVGQKIAVQSGKVLDSYEARAAEDAENVFARELSHDDAAVPPEGGELPKDARTSATPGASGGS